MAGSVPPSADAPVPGDLDPSVMAEIDHRIEADLERELEKLRGLGKVKATLEQRKTRKLARAVLKKANFGPLDEKSSGSLRRGSRRSSEEKSGRGGRRRRRRSGKEKASDSVGDGVVVGRREIGGRFKEQVLEAQEEELDQLRSMEVVKKHLSKRETFARARRMFNRRVVPRPSSSRHTSFLVSGYEEPVKEDVADYIRQQSVVVIDNFFSIPPKERRVLNRLTSTQMRWISDAELAKVEARKGGRLDDLDEIGAGRAHDSEPTEIGGVHQQQEPEIKSKRRHHLRKNTKHAEEVMEKSSTKKASKRKRSSKGESWWHRWDVVEEDVIEEAASRSRRADGEKRRHRRSQGDSEGHVLKPKKNAWKRRGWGRTDAVEQLEVGREPGVTSAPLRSKSSGGSFQELAGPEFIPLGEPQPQPTSQLLSSTQGSTDVASEERSGSASSMKEATSPRAFPYFDSALLERGEEVEDVFYDEEVDFCDGETVDTQQISNSLLPPILAPPGMAPPPPRANGHTTITGGSHHTHVQTSSALDHSSIDSEIHALTEEQYAYGYVQDSDGDFATNDYQENGDGVSHEEIEQKAAAMGRDQMKEREEEPSELQRLAEEREESVDSSLGPPESPEQPPSRHLVPDHISPCLPLSDKDSGEDQPDGSSTSSPEPMMFAISGSISQTSSFDSGSNPSTGSSKYRRFFSSPQLSLTSAENSLHLTSHPYMTGLSLYPHTPHGYYCYDEEVNPFSVQFQEALRESEELTHERMKRSQDSGEAAAFNPQPSASASQHQSLDLPPHLLDDPNFRIYLAGLDHEPTRSDYISYKIAMIGDAIDAKYDTQLNQALDALFTEVLKNTITWDSFSRAAKKLMLQGQHIQDGIFMIPCFGRRLLEFVPELRSTVTGYTQRVMDNSWDLILTSGGWNALMEGYGQPELRPEYEDWDERQSHEEGEGQMDVVGAMGYDLFSPDPEHRGLADAIAATAAERESRKQTYERTPHTLPRTTGIGMIPPLPVSPQPHSLDDIITHPRVVDPHCLFPNPLTSETSPLFSGHLRRRVKSVEVLLAPNGNGDSASENDYRIPAGFSRLDSRRHSSPSIHCDSAFFLPTVSSPIPIPSVRAHDYSSHEELSSTPHVISLGNGRRSPVMEFFSREEAATYENRHGFMSVSRAFSHTHSREGSISSIGSCSTIHIVTGEETLVEDLHVAAPVSPEQPNGEQLEQHGHPHSGASVSNQHPGSTPGSSHSTGGSRAADRTANGYSTSDYIDLGFGSLDFANRGRPGRNSTDSVFTSDVGPGEWRSSPRPRRRRRSSLQVVSETVAAVGPILTHAAIGVFAVLFAGQ